jgi:hypothetical protein
VSESKSRYQSRPGLMQTSGKLASIEGRTGLRVRQERRVAQSCTIKADHDHGIWLLEDSGARNLDRCNGVPWPTPASRKADADA